MKSIIFLSFLLFTVFKISHCQETQILYLSGTGSNNTVDWQFSCNGGRNSGKWSVIPVPSNWEFHGFGTFNYGLAKDSVRGRETGFYKYSFNVPDNWINKTVNLVFEGSMTDTEVEINGFRAGNIHQGSFYRFKYNVTEFLNYGDKSNNLNVTVAKHSANKSVNNAERFCDYWIFGGIYRPVYLEALPKQHMRQVSINAKANGEFDAEISILNAKDAPDFLIQIFEASEGKAISSLKIKSSGDSIVHVKTKVDAPKLWSPEFPNMYKVRITMLAKNKVIHFVEKKFGFRTIELRERDGIYLNGTKIKFKGVNRHSFWPSSGRTLSKDISIIDVNLMKDMNMNAVRMSHYPPDEHFLDVCDSLGLMVINELAGWHKAYDYETGARLVAEMISRDVNHPCIVMWANGNEGGFNFDLDSLFDKLDIQHRPLIHPWAVFRGTDTQHYINYDYGNGTHFHGHNVVFPTEFLHGLYDGGLGAGLDDYWELMWQNPLSAGGFLWAFSDEAVVRGDLNGKLDADGSHGPDGILGPYREKEGSFFTIKEVWSPIFFEHKEITPAFDGNFIIENRFFFTNLDQCKAKWTLERMPEFSSEQGKVSKSGSAMLPGTLPGQRGILKLSLPSDWHGFDVLYITLSDPYKREIFTWSFPITRPEQMAERIIQKNGNNEINISYIDSVLIANSGNIKFYFSGKSGLLNKIENTSGTIPLGNGPLLCEGEATPQKINYRKENRNLIIEAEYIKKSLFKELKWTIFPSGWLKLDVKYFPLDYESTFLGISFSFPENSVTGAELVGNGPYRVWKNRMKGTTLNFWKKDYNNTVTGDSGFVYPEFKGYYSNLYWVKILTAEQPFTVVCATEDVFLRLLTPKSPREPFNTAPPFPIGNISFMHGIPAIGTKSQKAENMGPSGRKNMYFDYWKAEPKEMTLYFDFSGK